jgi:hypothetical protein
MELTPAGAAACQALPLEARAWLCELIGITLGELLTLASQRYGEEVPSYIEALADDWRQLRTLMGGDEGGDAYDAIDA